MPTFKNDTKHYIDYEAITQSSSGERKKILLRFVPGEERALGFWLPYQKLGLTLVNADYPPVQNKILISGTFEFSENMERLFSVDHCDRYVINIIVQSGKIKLYTGASTVGQEVAEDSPVAYRYRGVLEWEFAPYFKIVTSDNKATVTLSVEVCTDTLASQRTGDELTWH